MAPGVLFGQIIKPGLLPYGLNQGYLAKYLNQGQPCLYGQIIKPAGITPGLIYGQIIINQGYYCLFGQIIKPGLLPSNGQIFKPGVLLSIWPNN